jgi:iron complex transport system substrate-binding protein
MPPAAPVPPRDEERRRPAPFRRRAVGVLLGTVLAAGSAAGSTVVPATGGERPRVASASVCADQYVLALADPEDIAALSPDAGDARLSLLSDRAAGHRLLRPGAEVYLDAGVDVVVSDAWSDHQTAALLRRFGVKVVGVPLADDFDAVAAATREVAEAVGQPGRGEALVAAMRRRLAAVAAAAPGRGRLALYLRPDGGTAGSRTYVDAVMAVAGLRNQAAEQGGRGWGHYGLERFLATPPDLIVTSYFDAPRPSGAAFGNHPAFTDRAAGLPRVEVPGAMWVCGAWILVEAAEHLARELNREPAGTGREASE